MVLVTAAPGLKCSVAKGREVGWSAAAVGSCLIPAAAWAGWSLQMLLDWQSAGESCSLGCFLFFFLLSLCSLPLTTARLHLMGVQGNQPLSMN